MAMDQKLKGKLIIPRDGKDKLALAAIEAVRMKKLVGAIRSLWRSSPSGANHPNVTALKKLLKPSPRKAKPQNENEDSDAGLVFWMHKKEISCRDDTKGSVYVTLLGPHGFFGLFFFAMFDSLAQGFWR